MIIKQYLYDLQKWEVVVLEESSSNDKRIGIYDTEPEAIVAVENHMKKCS